MHPPLNHCGETELMKKKVALAVGAVLVVGGLGACWYTGNTFDRILAEQIARAQQESGIEVTWSPETENLFTRDGVLKVVVPPQTLASFDPSWREATHRDAVRVQQPPVAALYQEPPPA